MTRGYSEKKKLVRLLRWMAKLEGRWVANFVERWVAKLVGRWVGKLAWRWVSKYLLATAALWVRIQTSPENTKWAA
jgi:hypothetical protein